MTDNPLVVNLTHGTTVVLERQPTYVVLSVHRTVGAVVLTLDEARRIGHWLIAGPDSGSPCVHCTLSLESCLAAACCDACQYEGRRHSHHQPSSGGPNDHR